MIKRLILLVMISGVYCSGTLPNKLDKKVNKVISSYFEVADFSKTPVPIPEDIAQTLSSDFSNNLFKIKSDDKALGYVYLGNAPSKTATFDYLVLFDTNFIIRTSKVLIYREEYGGEISSKRWLRQFNGQRLGDEKLQTNINISAISGATISVRSMTRAINNLLESLTVLQKAEVL